ncbi:pyrophosphohydrolase domain-containing protein, partial [Streptomyces sp. NPDC002920]
MSNSSPADLVREFHRAFGLDARSTPTEVSPRLAAHRGELLAEEAAEVAEVSVGGPLDRLAHELADVVYVAYGTALVHGIDLDAVIAEIHRSNMTKLGPDGQVVRRPYRPPTSPSPRDASQRKRARSISPSAGTFLSR